MYVDDTIFALATPVGGALAVLRVSGKKSAALLGRVFSGKCVQKPRELCYGRLINGEGECADTCMAVYFEAPRSYSGEDMAELYLHGGAAVVREAMSVILKSGLVRVAEPGEFTKRAFMNGKMSLSSAEAVMDVIQAQTERSLKAAQEQMEGGLQGRIERLEDELRGALAGLDAAIDYPEELEEDVESALPQTLSRAEKELLLLLENGEKARLLREGARVVIAGRPNAGKSSLLNAFLDKERAIVTDVAGTTRDIIEESTDFCGVPVRLYDTAGIRESGDEVEKIGVERARGAMEKADLLFIAIDASKKLDKEEYALLEDTKDRKRIVLLCKSDLTSVVQREELPKDCMVISARTGEGMEALKDAAAKLLVGTQSAYVTNARHIAALQSAREALLQAEQAEDMECRATDIRDALLSLGAITGSSVDESVIDSIFSSFCVGK